MKKKINAEKRGEISNKTRCHQRDPMNMSIGAVPTTLSDSLDALNSSAPHSVQKNFEVFHIAISLSLAVLLLTHTYTYIRMPFAVGSGLGVNTHTEFAKKLKEQQS